MIYLQLVLEVMLACVIKLDVIFCQVAMLV